jgi:hypothetical protein
VELESVIDSAGKDGHGMPSCGITVDEEGDWYYQGNKIIRENILDLFYENLHITPEGEFFIEWRQSRCILETADTPFVISMVDRKGYAAGEDEEIYLYLRHLQGFETLDPSTLKVGKDNVLYCRIRKGIFPARFSRAAYYRLAQWIEEDAGAGSFYLTLNGNRYTIEMQ